MTTKSKKTTKAKTSTKKAKATTKKQPVGTDIGMISKAELARESGRPRVKAVLFVPEGQDPTKVDLNIQVVSVDKAGLGLIAMRRC